MGAGSARLSRGEITARLCRCGGGGGLSVGGRHQPGAGRGAGELFPETTPGAAAGVPHPRRRLVGGAGGGGARPQRPGRCVSPLLAQSRGGLRQRVDQLLRHRRTVERVAHPDARGARQHRGHRPRRGPRLADGRGGAGRPAVAAGARPGNLVAELRTTDERPRRLARARQRAAARGAGRARLRAGGQPVACELRD